jgi:hypothetical protein
MPACRTLMPGSLDHGAFDSPTQAVARQLGRSAT